LISRAFSNEPYFNLKTKKRDGRQVPTPVWFVLGSDESDIIIANINSGKVKRMRNFPETQTALCNWRGAVYGPWIALTAILIEESDEVLKLFRSKYGIQFHISEWASRISGKRKERQFIRPKEYL
tara:strand:+ start:79 stop:453 length:375 start_codon:yes stop_codon:yes gene_type:complete